MFNKRGQGETFFAIIIIVGVIVLLVVGAGVYYGYSKVFSAWDTVDIQSLTVPQICGNSFSVDSSGTNFCTGAIEVGDKAYINCPFARDFYGVAISQDSLSPDATLYECKNAEIKICNRLSNEQDNFKADKYMINGASCSFWTACDGTWAIVDTTCPEGLGIVKTITAGSHKSILTNTKCCSATTTAAVTPKPCAETAGPTGFEKGKLVATADCTVAKQKLTVSPVSDINIIPDSSISDKTDGMVCCSVKK